MPALFVLLLLLLLLRDVMDGGVCQFFISTCTGTSIDLATKIKIFLYFFPIFLCFVGICPLEVRNQSPVPTIILGVMSVVVELLPFTGTRYEFDMLTIY